MAFFLIIIFAFSMMMGLLVKIDTETYDVLGPISYYVMIFRTSIGDYNLDNYSKKSTYHELAWILWLLVMIVGNMIFMNFIIAVVNESYENCMSKMVAQSYKVKVDLIVERESIMKPSVFKKNKDWFPNFLIVRRAIDGEGSGNGGQWQGFVREISNNAEKSITKVQHDLTQKIQQNKTLFEEQMDDLTKKQSDLKELLEKVQTNHEN